MVFFRVIFFSAKDPSPVKLFCAMDPIFCVVRLRQRLLCVPQLTHTERLTTMKEMELSEQDDFVFIFFFQIMANE